MDTPGGTLVKAPTIAALAQNGVPEAVVPLPDLAPSGANVTVNMTILGTVKSEQELLQFIKKGLAAESRRTTFAATNVGS